MGLASVVLLMTKQYYVLRYYFTKTGSHGNVCKSILVESKQHYNMWDTWNIMQIGTFMLDYRDNNVIAEDWQALSEICSI